MSAFLTNTGGASFNRDQGGAGRDYKRTQSDYGRAMRLLRRASYKDPNAALKMIDLRDTARERGVEIGGAPSAEDTARNSAAYTSNMERMAADREREAGMNVGMADRVGALENAMEPEGKSMVKKDISGRIINPMRKPETPVTGNPTRGVLDAPAESRPRLSLAEQDRVTREERFGKDKLSRGRRY